MVSSVLGHRRLRLRLARGYLVVVLGLPRLLGLRRLRLRLLRLLWVVVWISVSKLVGLVVLGVPKSIDKSSSTGSSSSTSHTCARARRPTYTLGVGLGSVGTNGSESGLLQPSPVAVEWSVVVVVVVRVAIWSRRHLLLLLKHRGVDHGRLGAHISILTSGLLGTLGVLVRSGGNMAGGRRGHRLLGVIVVHAGENELGSRHTLGGLLGKLLLELRVVVVLGMGLFGDFFWLLRLGLLLDWLAALGSLGGLGGLGGLGWSAVNGLGLDGLALSRLTLSLLALSLLALSLLALSLLSLLSLSLSLTLLLVLKRLVQRQRAERNSNIVHLGLLW